MSDPTPRGKRAPLPVTTWETRVVWSGEQLLDDEPDSLDDIPTTPRQNRATRRALNRKKNRRA